MSEHRFILKPYKRPSDRWECPNCHRKRCFSPYIDTENKITFPNFVGRCDHEQSCGYHYTPKQFFADNPMEKERCKDFSVVSVNRPIITKPKQPYYFDKALMEKTLTHYAMNPLAVFLSSKLGKEETERLFRLYNVGTAKGGRTVYWQVDGNQRIRTAKLMDYDAKSGHRLKDFQHHVSWLHSQMVIDKVRIRQCFFGEHLLARYPDKPIAIVESEKSAVVASHFLPQYVWLASGGKDGMFNRADHRLFIGRRVILFPDLGMVDNWKRKVAMLRSKGIGASLFPFLEEKASDIDRQNGLDIADFLLQPTDKKALLQAMMEHNPALRLLVEKLELEVVE